VLRAVRVRRVQRLRVKKFKFWSFSNISFSPKRRIPGGPWDPVGPCQKREAAGSLHKSCISRPQPPDEYWARPYSHSGPGESSFGEPIIGEALGVLEPARMVHTRLDSRQITSFARASVASFNGPKRDPGETFALGTRGRGLADCRGARGRRGARAARAVRGDYRGMVDAIALPIVTVRLFILSEQQSLSQQQSLKEQKTSPLPHILQWR
jgi:hypothetical protein